MDKVAHKSRHSFTWIKYAVAFVIFAVSIGFLGEHSVLCRMERNKEISELQQKIAEQQQRFAEEHEALERLKNDPEEVRRVAREHYYMKKDNEDVFIIEDEK